MASHDNVDRNQNRNQRWQAMTMTIGQLVSSHDNDIGLVVRSHDDIEQLVSCVFSDAY
jgi:hypothetical protein